MMLDILDSIQMKADSLNETTLGNALSALIVLYDIGRLDLIGNTVMQNTGTIAAAYRKRARDIEADSPGDAEDFRIIADELEDLRVPTA
jgi:hypothetical protein